MSKNYQHHFSGMFLFFVYFHGMYYNGFFFSDVNVQGEGGATPLHYAARYVAKSVRANPSPNVTPAMTKKSSSSKNIRSVFAQKNFSAAFAKVMPKRLSMPHIVDMVIRKSPKKSSEDYTLKTLRRSETVPSFESKLNEETAIPKSESQLPRFLKPKSISDFANMSDEVAEENERPKSIFELSRMLEKQEETSFQIGSMWEDCSSKYKLGKHKSFEYRYDGDKMLPPSKRGVIISTNQYVQDNVDIQNIDALILSVVSKELKCNPNTSVSDLEKKRRRGTGTFYLSPDLIEEDVLNSSSEEALSEDDVVFAEPIVNSYLNQKEPFTSKSNSNDSMTGNGLLNLPLGINNLAFRNSHENLTNESILKYLLQHKANVNAKDSFGSTALHYAAMRGNEMAVQQLLCQHDINIEVTYLNILPNWHNYLLITKLLISLSCFRTVVIIHKPLSLKLSFIILG